MDCRVCAPSRLRPAARLSGDDVGARRGWPDGWVDRQRSTMQGFARQSPTGVLTPASCIRFAARRPCTVRRVGRSASRRLTIATRKVPVPELSKRRAVFQIVMRTAEAAALSARRPGAEVVTSDVLLRDVQRRHWTTSCPSGEHDIDSTIPVTIKLRRPRGRLARTARRLTSLLRSTDPQGSSTRCLDWCSRRRRLDDSGASTAARAVSC